MLAFRWFEVFLLLSNVGRTILTDEGREASLFFDLSDAETILNFQTSLRRYLINSLGNIREKEKITRAEEFQEAIDEIIQELQTRATDPFKAFRGDNSELPQMAEIIYNLQGRRGFTLEEWKSLTEILPQSKPSNIQRIPENVQKIHTTGAPFVITILNAVHKSNLSLTGRLLADILYNYRFRDYSPELDVVLENIGQMLEGISLNFSDIQFEGTSSDEILRSILNFISQNQQSNPELVYQIGLLLPKLYKTGNTPLIKDSSELWRLFDLMLPDDYPPDIIQTKNALSSMIRDNQVGLNLSKVGHHPRERLLMLIAKLSSIPSVRRKAQAVYPHVKLWHLSLLGKFFHPQTATDVAFLLDSFLTAPIKLNPTFMNEIRKIFLLPDFNWKEVLKDFDYSRYSKPRPLVLNMMQELLNNSSKYPVCCIILLDYFLRSTRQIPLTSDVFSGTMSSIVTSDAQGVTRPVMSPLGRFISTIVPLSAVSADSVTDSGTTSQSFTSEMVSTTPSQNSEFGDQPPSSTLFTYSGTSDTQTSDSALSIVLDNTTEITPMDYTSQTGMMIPTTTATPDHSLPPTNSKVSTDFLSMRNTDKLSTGPFNLKFQLISSTTESNFSSFDSTSGSSQAPDL